MSFGDVRKALDAYAAYLDSIGCLSSRRLRPGLSEAQAQEAAHGLGLTLPEDALAIWTWHDGEGAAADFPALCLGGRGGFFNTLRFPSLKVAFRVAEYAASYCEVAEAASTGDAQSLMLEDIGKDFVSYVDLDGPGAPARLWDVPFMVDRGRPVYTVDCRDRGDLDALCRKTTEFGFSDPCGLGVAQVIEQHLEDLRSQVSDGELEVDSYGVLRCVPQG